MSRTTSLRPLAAVLLLALTSLTFAQEPDGPYWSSLPVPPNFVSIQALGSTVYVRTTTEARLFSGITRTWTFVPFTTANPQVSLFNRYAIIIDGSTITGFSTQTGAAQSITVSPAAIVTHGPLTSSWITVVQDGLDLYGFGAFAGFWDHLTLQSTTTTAAAGSLAAVVEDGVNAYGISAYTGSFSVTPAAGVTVAAGGAGAFAYDTNQVWCYSANWSAWTNTIFPNASAPTMRDGFAAFVSGPTVLCYSELTHSFAAQTIASGIVALSTNRNAAAVPDSSDVHCYAPGTNTWTTIATDPSAIVTVQQEFVLIDDGASIVAFSGLSGVVAPPLVGTYTTFNNEDVCFAQGATSSAAYSPMTGVWTPAPNVTPIQIQTVRNAAFIVHANGYEAYSSRYGTWTSLATSVPATFATSSAGATFAAIDVNLLSVFDSRLGKWKTVTMAAPYVASSIWRQVLIAHDNTNLYGYSLLNNTWESIALSGPVVQFNANSSAGYARTATDLYVYTANGSFSTTSRYSEFTRMQSRGTPLRVTEVAPPGSIVTMGASLLPADVPVGAFGTLHLDVASLILVQSLGLVPVNGALDVSFLVPNVPQLNNVQVFLQNLIQTPSGGIYFSNLVAPVII